MNKLEETRAFPVTVKLEEMRASSFTFKFPPMRKMLLVPSEIQFPATILMLLNRNPDVLKKLMNSPSSAGRTTLSLYERYMVPSIVTLMYCFSNVT